MAYKLKYPKCVTLLRGNHESKIITTHFNFREECLKKYDNEIYEMFITLFYNLPICAVIDQTYFAVHAGISPELQSLSKLISM